MLSAVSLDAELTVPHRIAIVLAVLSTAGGRVGFAELVAQLAMSDGNLACHLRRLQKAGLIQNWRNGGRGRASRTEYMLTSAGLARLETARDAFVSTAGAISRALNEASASADQSILQVSAIPATTEELIAPEVPVAPSVVAASILDERFSGPD